MSRPLLANGVINEGIEGYSGNFIYTLVSTAVDGHLSRDVNPWLRHYSALGDQKL